MKKCSSETRKVQVLRAARTLFAKKGYAETTLDDIAGLVGVSRPRVIQLFGSKQAIYEAIAETAYQSHPIDEDLAEPISRNDDFGVFKAFALHILEHTTRRKDREIVKILMYARLREDRFHRTHFHKRDKLMVSRLADYVRRRIKEGAFRQMDYRTIIYAYQAMITNLVIYKNVLKEMKFVNIETLSRDCARIFLDGISNNSDRAGGKGSRKRKE